MSYAQGTSVSVAKSQAEIQDMLGKWGAQLHGFSFFDEYAMIAFTIHSATQVPGSAPKSTAVMMRLSLPPRARFARRPHRNSWKDCTPEEQSKLWEQACRERWRGLVLSLKAKLVSVEMGVETVEEAFLAHLVVADAGKSKRFGEMVIRQIVEHQNGGGRLLLGSGA